MDWKKTFNYGPWGTHFLFAIILCWVMAVTLFVMRLNHLQKSEEARILKINSLIDFWKQDNSFEKIAKYLSRAEADKALDKMRELTGKMAETEDLVALKASEGLSQSIRSFNKMINANSSISDPSDVLKLLNQKVKSLGDFAKVNNYKNVSLIATRMEDRLKLLNFKNVGGSVQLSYLKSDLQRLFQLAENSSLSDTEKKSLLAKLESMKNEMTLLDGLHLQTKDLKSHVNQASLSLINWLMEVEARTANIRNDRTEKQNQLVLLLVSLVAFIIFSWIGFAYLHRWQRIKISLQVENEVKGVIQKGILEDQRFMMDHYSKEIREDIVRLLDDLKIKLNLGTLLHEGLPFAGCMIDSNFKLTWHNNLFLDQLYLSEEEVRSDAFNWDYVKDYLNLENDPIYEAMVNKIAGIYPVKVKQDDMTPAQPYEMYVTPISANREDRVMVFLYPLISMNESINNQVELVRQSLRRFISLWGENKLDEDELRLLERDFKSNDLADIYQELSGIFENVESQKEDFLFAIHNLELTNSSHLEEITTLDSCLMGKINVLKEQVKLSKELKKSFITSLGKSDSLLQINRLIMQQNDEYRNEVMRMQGLTNEYLKKNKETLEILSQLESVQANNKKLKFELLEIKAKLISMNNSLFAQLPPLDDNQQKLASRYKDELARLDFNVVTLEKKLSLLDVFLAKLQMMNERHSGEQISFSLLTSQKDHELRESILEIQKTLTSDESKIINYFKNLDDLMKKGLQSERHEQPSSHEGHVLS
jgi:hypothetical protein